MTETVRVAIVGGGIGGIVSVKECLDEGLLPVCFEQHDQIGGVWYYSDACRPNQGAALYPSLVTNSSKCRTEFSDFPMPKSYPPYLPHYLMYEYLESYAKHFRLKDYFQLNTEVLKIEKSADHEISGNWDLTLKWSDGTDVSINKETFPRVILAIGNNKIPITPFIDGKNVFRGEQMHSRDFRCGESFKNKRVLVIGNANSAGDVAVDISRHAKTVILSVGSGLYLLKRIADKGIPKDLLARRFSIPFSWLFGYNAKKEAYKYLDHELYGLKSDEENVFKAAICVNDELGWRIACGKVLPKSYTVQLTADGALFDDGTRIEELDAVIYATGYGVNFDLVEDGVVSDVPTTRQQELNLYKYIWPLRSKHNTLAVVGIVSSNGSLTSVIELQCRWIAQVFSGKMGLPAQRQMADDVKNAKEQMKRECGEKFRVDNLTYCDQIADIIGAKPRFMSLLFRDPTLAFLCFYGPAFPVQYRLTGPHNWSGARQATIEAYRNTFSALKRRSLRKTANGENMFLQILLSVLCLVVGGVFYGREWLDIGNLKSLNTNS